MVISTILSDFLDGLEAEKQNVPASTGQTIGSIGAKKFSPPAVYISLSLTSLQTL